MSVYQAKYIDTVSKGGNVGSSGHGALGKNVFPSLSSLELSYSQAAMYSGWNI